MTDAAPSWRAPNAYARQDAEDDNFYDTISDVILHIRYTAWEGGGLLRNGAVDNLKTQIKQGQAAGSVRLFSIRHEFLTEWAKFKPIQLDDTIPVAELTLNLRQEHYPFWSQGRLEAVKRADLFAKMTENRVDIFDQPTDQPTYQPPDQPGTTLVVHKDTLVKDNSLGNLRAGKLTNIPLPAPTGKITLYFNDNSLEDLWLALAWGKADS